MEALLRDLRYGIRMLWRTPGITGVAVLALALGIGVNSALFSVVYAVLLRPLPVQEIDRLVTLAQVSKKINATGAQPQFATYAVWRREGRSFESVAAAAPGTAAVAAGGPESTAKVWRVTESFFPALGVAPVLGRNFCPDEDQPGAAKVAIVADAYWRGRLNADRRALGTTLTIDGEPHTVIGVAPPGFHVDGRPADVYAPIARSLDSRQALGVNIYLRLKPGVTIEQAQAELDARTKNAPRGPLGWEPRLWHLRDFQVRNVRLSLWVLLAAVGLVLLIACCNVATLLLARSSARRREVAVRSAMGADWRRLVRQLLTESMLLAAAGGLCGLLVASLSIRLLPLLQHERLPGLLEQTRVDGVVLAFTLAVSLATGLLFGTAPALAARRVDLIETLKEGGRAGTGAVHKRGWNFLVVVETALAVVLAIGASLLIRTFFYLRDVAPGFAVDHLLTARIVPPKGKLTSREQHVAYYAELVERARRIPGVQAATFAGALPLTGDNWVASFPVEGHPFGTRPEELPVMTQRNADLQYFRTMQIPLRRGRLFTEGDHASAPRVAIVNEAFVRRFWPGQDGVGKHLGGYKGGPTIDIVGVVGDVRSEDATKDASPEVYLPALQAPPPRIALALRADPRVYPNALALETPLRQAVAAVDPAQPITHVAEMQSAISERIAPNRLSAQLIAIFAALALALAAVGIYGVLSFTVAQRTHEIGVRFALGADRGRLIATIVGQAALLAGAGVALGVAAAMGLTQVMKTLLFGVSETAPAVYVGSCAALLAIAVLAALAPAYRAVRVDPVSALRVQ